MITVSATELLKVIDATLAAKVEPSLGDVDGRSALATVRHLLNFVRVRVEDEGQILFDDCASLRNLLGEIAEYHNAAGDAAEAAAIGSVLGAATTRDPNRYPRLDDLTAEARALREGLHQALARLQAVRPARRDDPAYQKIRGAIRTLIVKEIEQEGTLVAPAFFGRGPRR